MEDDNNRKVTVTVAALKEFEAAVRIRAAAEIDQFRALAALDKAREAWEAAKVAADSARDREVKATNKLLNRGDF